MKKYDYEFECLNALKFNADIAVYKLAFSALHRENEKIRKIVCVASQLALLIGDFNRHKKE